MDLGDLQNERESISSFLRSKLKVEITSRGNKLLIDFEILSPKELKRLVNKFVYHRNLMNKYWVGLEGNIMKINKFKRLKRKKRKEKRTSPSTIKHGW